MIIPEANIQAALFVLSACIATGSAAACAFLKRSLDKTVKDRNALMRRHESFVEESSRQIQSFARISAIIASSLQRDQLLSQILLVLGDYLPGTSIRLLVYHPDGRLERIGTNERQSKAELAKPTNENLFTMIASISGGVRNAEWDVFLDQDAMKHYVYNFPFIAEEEFKGSLVVAGAEPMPERTRLFLGDIATLIASAHQNILTARQKERINEQFGKSVDPKVRDHLLSAADPGSIREVTVLFLDIRNFTTRSEALGPTGTVAFLNGIFAECDRIIRSRSGFINKFTGDGFMAVFGAPEVSRTHAKDAVDAAMELIGCLRGKAEPVEAGIGLATGEALAGTIGSEQRMEYTVIGDTVNTASRIEGLNKLFGTPVLASGKVLERIQGNDLQQRYLGAFILKGKHKSVEVYGIRAVEDTPPIECWSPDFDRAVNAYFSGNFSEAGELFSLLGNAYPHDRAVQWYLRRCRERREHPAPWEGVERMNEK